MVSKRVSENLQGSARSNVQVQVCEVRPTSDGASLKLGTNYLKIVICGLKPCCLVLVLHQVDRIILLTKIFLSTKKFC